MIHHLTAENFQQEVISTEEKTLVEFFSDTCAPCAALAPILEELSEETDIKVCAVNISKERDLARKYTIMSVPTLLLFQGKEILGSAVGYRTKEDLKIWMEKY